VKNLAALDQFNRVGVINQVEGASPHTLIAMLFDGLLSRLATARGHMERKQMREQGEMISKSIAIVDGLRASLDHSQGGELAQHLGDLYDYMEVRLLQANSQSDSAAVEDVIGLVRELKTGWNGIDPRAADDA
jgi:flagellar protein FliS